MTDDSSKSHNRTITKTILQNRNGNEKKSVDLKKKGRALNRAQLRNIRSECI